MPDLHVIVVLSVAIGLACALVKGLIDLRSARKALSQEDDSASAMARFLGAATLEDASAKLTLRGTTLVQRMAHEALVVAGAGGNLDTGSIRKRVISELEHHPKFSRNLANYAVYIGLLGTLIGLAMAVQTLNQIPPIKDPQDLRKFGDVTRQMFGSFGLAFVAAAAGIIVTVVLSWMLSAYDRASAVLANTIEAFCIDDLAAIVSQIVSAKAPKSPEEAYTRLLSQFSVVSNEALEKISGITTGFAKAGTTLLRITEKLTTASEQVSTAVGSANEQSIAAIAATSNVATEIRHATEAVAKNTEDLVQQIGKFDSQPLIQANQLMARVVPNMEAGLISVVSAASQQQGGTLENISSVLAESRSMLSNTAGMVSELDQIVRELMQVALRAERNPAPTQVTVDFSELTNAVIGLRRDLSSRTPSTELSPAIPEGQDIQSVPQVQNYQFNELTDAINALRREIVNRPIVQPDGLGGGGMIVNSVPTESLEDLRSMKFALEKIQRIMEKQADQERIERLEAKRPKGITKLWRRGKEPEQL